MTGRRSPVPIGLKVDDHIRAIRQQLEARVRLLEQRVRVVEQQRDKWRARSGEFKAHMTRYQAELAAERTKNRGRHGKE